MGSISNTNSKFVKVNINLEDLFNVNGHAVRFALASLGVYFLRRAAPEIAEEIKGNINTLTDWYLKNGELVVMIGKNGFTQDEVTQAISDHKQYEQGLSG